MPKKRLVMRKLREIFRLKFELGRTHREIATSCKVSAATVSDMVRRLGLVGLSWPCELGNEALEEILYRRPLEVLEPAVKKGLPDWPSVHKELKNPKVHMTLKQIWVEYKAKYSDSHFGYSWFCDNYRAWAKVLEPVMRQTHKYGDKCFVDFAGDTLSVIDPETGEVREAQVFVGTMGASNYIYCDVCWSQDLPTWLRLHVDMFEFFGCCPAALVPDNLKSGVTKACYFEPAVNISYEELAKYYGVAVLPARVRKPKDKAKVETGVLIVEREILAPLRNRTIIGLPQAKEAVWEKLEVVNSRPFQKLSGNRLEVFLEYETPVMKKLPRQRYEAEIWTKARVPMDYHVLVKGHHYSVPFQHIGRKLELRITAVTVEAFWEGERVASHKRSWQKGGCTTRIEHMTKEHRFFKEWTPEKFASWADSVGIQTKQFTAEIFERAQHPDQGVRICHGLLTLRKEYGRDRLEAACRRAVLVGAFSYKSIVSILAKKLDEKPLPDGLPKRRLGTHENVRGASYYGTKMGVQHVIAANY
jgi:transposase